MDLSDSKILEIEKIYEDIVKRLDSTTRLLSEYQHAASTPAPVIQPVQLMTYPSSQNTVQKQVSNHLPAAHPSYILNPPSSSLLSGKSSQPDDESSSDCADALLMLIDGYVNQCENSEKHKHSRAKLIKTRKKIENLTEFKKSNVKKLLKRIQEVGTEIGNTNQKRDISVQRGCSLDVKDALVHFSDPRARNNCLPPPDRSSIYHPETLAHLDRNHLYQNHRESQLNSPISPTSPESWNYAMPSFVPETQTQSPCLDSGIQSPSFNRATNSTSPNVVQPPYASFGEQLSLPSNQMHPYSGNMLKASNKTTGGQTPYPSHGDQAPYPSNGGQAPYPSNGVQAPYPSNGGQAPYPSNGVQAPYPSNGGQAPYPSNGGQAPYPSNGGQAPYISNGVQAPYPTNSVQTGYPSNGVQAGYTSNTWTKFQVPHPSDSADTSYPTNNIPAFPQFQMSASGPSGKGHMSAQPIFPENIHGERRKIFQNAPTTGLQAAYEQPQSYVEGHHEYSSMQMSAHPEADYCCCYLAKSGMPQTNDTQCPSKRSALKDHHQGNTCCIQRCSSAMKPTGCNCQHKPSMPTVSICDLHGERVCKPSFHSDPSKHCTSDQSVQVLSESLLKEASHTNGPLMSVIKIPHLKTLGQMQENEDTSRITDGSFVTDGKSVYYVIRPETTPVYPVIAESKTHRKTTQQEDDAVRLKKDKRGKRKQENNSAHDAGDLDKELISLGKCETCGNLLSDDDEEQSPSRKPRTGKAIRDYESCLCSFCFPEPTTEQNILPSSRSCESDISLPKQLSTNRGEGRNSIAESCNLDQSQNQAQTRNEKTKNIVQQRSSLLTTWSRSHPEVKANTVTQMRSSDHMFVKLLPPHYSSVPRALDPAVSDEAFGMPGKAGSMPDLCPSVVGKVLRVAPTTEQDMMRKQALMKIFTYLDFKALCTVSQVCKEWRMISHTPSLWKKIKISNERVSHTFLKVISSWCIQVHSIILTGLKPRCRYRSESDQQWEEATLGSLEPGIEMLLNASNVNIHTITIMDCGNLVTENILHLIGCYCPLLQRLAFSSPISPVGKEMLYALGSGCRLLDTVLLPPVRGSKTQLKFNDECCSVIGRAWPSLKVLCIGGPGVTATGLITIAKLCQDLQILELERMLNITKNIVEAMTKVGLQKLQLVELVYTLITPQALRAFGDGCPKLVKFSYEDEKTQSTALTSNKAQESRLNNQHSLTEFEERSAAAVKEPNDEMFCRRASMLMSWR